MGSDLCLNSPVARTLFDEANSVLGFDLAKLCFEGPEDQLRQTINAQPAILSVSVACLKTVTENDNRRISRPSYVAGHSLGEYTALVAADVLDFADALRLVRERGRLMHEAGAKEPGSMAAVMGLDEATVEQVCQQAGAEIANLNSADQIVISGRREAVARALDLARALGARRVVPLDVSGAFHSSLMEPTIDGMVKAIGRFRFREPSVPIVVNSLARPVTTADAIKAELIRQLCHCVHWQRSVEYMVRAGVSTFIEVGPGQVLSGLIKRIDRNIEALSLNDAALAKKIAG
ncbi:MAG: ACP S-malonyltransferase [Chloroflexi bacterium]|nr:ACP S-malonyltransferase [Chloroflexota bacterium]